MSALEKFLMKAKGAGKNLMRGKEVYGPEAEGLFKGAFRNGDRAGGLIDKAEGAGRWMKENPKTAVAGAIGAGGGGALLADELGDDDDSLEGLLSRGKEKISGLADDANDGIQGLLKRLGLS